MSSHTLTFTPTAGFHEWLLIRGPGRGRLTDLAPDVLLHAGLATQHVDRLLDALVDDLHVVERLLADRLLLVDRVRTLLRRHLHVPVVVQRVQPVLLLALDVVTQRAHYVVGVGVRSRQLLQAA